MRKIGGKQWDLEAPVVENVQELIAVLPDGNDVLEFIEVVRPVGDHVVRRQECDLMNAAAHANDIQRKPVGVAAQTERVVVVRLPKLGAQYGGAAASDGRLGMVNSNS